MRWTRQGLSRMDH